MSSESVVICGFQTLFFIPIGILYICITTKQKQMQTKAAQTTQFILETVSPIFNRKGYSGTSLSDITKATNLTKGAIYGNFKNKEELALAAFNHNIRFILDKIKAILTQIDSPLAKLHALTDFYRNYYKHNISFGGCPILNVGIDANNTNPKLFERVKSVTRKLQESIEKIISEGIEKGEIKENINADIYGGRIFSLIEGSVFTSVLLKDDKYLLDMMNHIDKMILSELQAI